MNIRVRFAPSPTGQVHIGNIRTAIFNWLFARHHGGRFLLRIEDTDRERSTDEAIHTLLACMDWLGLDYDEAPLYQSAQASHHVEAANRLLAEGKAYRGKSESGEGPIVYRIPYDCDGTPFVRTAGPAEIDVHGETPVVIDRNEISFATVSRKGNPTPETFCLAGFANLNVIGPDGNSIFSLSGTDTLSDVPRTISGGVRLRFIRREVFFEDLVKGTLAKPLDGMRNLVIVRSDGTPVFHLANVFDDVTQGITHIVRGDDHVENTYRHIFLFHSLGYAPPTYAHLPMIVNRQGKPYSKRDGDAFVGDFRTKGFLSEALFNYLTLLGWSPGDDREKMTRAELVAAFQLERVKSHPAQFDPAKLENLNGQYVAELPPETFRSEVRRQLSSIDWGSRIDFNSDRFSQVSSLMQGRTRTFVQVVDWKYFFDDEFEFDEKSARKSAKPEIVVGLRRFREHIAAEALLTECSVEDALRRAERESGLQEGALNLPLRLAITGLRSGAEIYPTAVLVGREAVLRRVDRFETMVQ